MNKFLTTMKATLKSWARLEHGHPAYGKSAVRNMIRYNLHQEFKSMGKDLAIKMENAKGWLSICFGLLCFSSKSL